MRGWDEYQRHRRAQEVRDESEFQGALSRTKIPKNVNSKALLCFARAMFVNLVFAELSCGFRANVPRGLTQACDSGGLWARRARAARTTGTQQGGRWTALAGRVRPTARESSKRAITDFLYFA